MGIMVDFGRRIRELRLKAGLTQELLALQSGLDRSYVGAIERGEKNISILNIEKLANALDVDLNYLFEDERFSPRATYLKRELKKPLTQRFTYDVNVTDQLISWKVQGPLSENDVMKLVQTIKSKTLLLKKGEIKLFIDNRAMVIDEQPFVFSPDVNAVWEELQSWMLPYLKQVVVLCNSKFMKNQLDRLAKRSGIDQISAHIFEPDQDLAEKAAFDCLQMRRN